jgi:excisionase family DNA binding protein
MDLARGFRDHGPRGVLARASVQAHTIRPALRHYIRACDLRFRQRHLQRLLLHQADFPSGSPASAPLPNTRLGGTLAFTMPDFTRETYWTVAELAQRLRLNEQTLRNWIDQGSLPAVRIGRRVRVLNPDFERR